METGIAFLIGLIAGACIYKPILRIRTENHELIMETVETGETFEEATESHEEPMPLKDGNKVLKKHTMIAAEQILGYINLAVIADCQPQKVLLSKAEEVLVEKAAELTMAEQANGYIKIAAFKNGEEKKRLIRKAEEILDGSKYKEEKLSGNCHGGRQLFKSLSMR